MPNLPTIACKECSHINEGERVYCHSCGVKLDRGVLLTQAVEEDPEKKRRRLKKMMSPSRHFAQGWGKLTAQALVCAAFTAAVIDIALPPSGIPPMPKERYVDAPLLESALENLLLAPAGTRVAFRTQEINGYLRNTAQVRRQDNPLDGYVKFERLFAGLEPGVCKLTLQASISGYALYPAVKYELTTDGNTLTSTPVGGSFGRLQIPKLLAPYFAPVLACVWRPFSENSKMMGGLASIEIKKGEMILTSRGPVIKSKLPPLPPTHSALDVPAEGTSQHGGLTAGGNPLDQKPDANAGPGHHK